VSLAVKLAVKASDALSCCPSSAMVSARTSMRTRLRRSSVHVFSLVRRRRRESSVTELTRPLSTFGNSRKMLESFSMSSFSFARSASATGTALFVTVLTTGAFEKSGTLSFSAACTAREAFFRASVASASLYSRSVSCHRSRRRTP